MVDDEFFLSAEFIRRLRAVGWRVVLPHDRNFSAAQERCPPEKTENPPIKVGAQSLRHQLRVETRNMKFRVLRHQLRAKARSMDDLFLRWRR